MSCTRCTRPRCRLVNSISLWVRLGLDKTRLGQLFGQNYLLHGSHAGDDAAAGSASVSHASKLDRCCTIRFYCSSLALAGTSRSARASRRSFKLRGSHRGKWCQCFFASPPPMLTPENVVSEEAAITLPENREKKSELFLGPRFEIVFICKGS